MSTGSIANNAARLTKALRVEDVLISAAAVPLPVDLSPSQLAQPGVDTASAANDAQAARTNPSADEDAQAHPSIADPPPAHAAPAEDAVAKSLQAAHDAIHDSLQTGSGDPSAQFAAAQPLDAHASDFAGATPTHSSTAADIAASTQSLSAATGHALAQPDLPTDMATLFPASMADGALANVLHEVQSVVGDLAGLLGPIAGAPIDVGATVAPAAAAVADVAATAEHVVQGAIGLLVPAGNETHPDAAPASAPANTATAPTAAPPPGAPEAVTVPSLHGAGFDALAGLLQPAPAVEPAHDVAPAHIGFDDLALLPPIGIEDIAHSDQAASHPAHALPPAGSGLI